MDNTQGHIHQFEHIEIPSTCTQRGYTLHRCACGYEHKDTFQPLIPHQYETIRDTNPTCTEEGSRQMQCKVCGAATTAPIPALGHDWGDWAVTNYATCTQDGSRTHTCSRCGTVESHTVKAIGHKRSKVQVNAEGKKECFCENCGEPMEVKFSGKRMKKLLIIALSLAVLAVAAVVGVKYLMPMLQYRSARNQIEEGNYMDAYTTLWDLGDYKDSRELLEDFVVVYKTEHIHFTDYDENGNFLNESFSKRTYEHDRYGYVTKKIAYDSLDNVVNDVSSSWEYAYDEDGNMTQQIAYDGQGAVDYKFEYAYDEDGNQILFIRYEGSSTIDYKEEYAYDKDGNQILYAHYDDGELDYKEESAYDENGNCILIVHYDENGELEYKTKITYDENGNCILRVRYDENGDIDCKYEYTYDENGNCILRVRYDENGDIEAKWEYTYDRDGNLILEESYNPDGKLIQKIEYPYQEDGSWQELHYRLDKDGVLYIYREYAYNANGLLTLDALYNADRELSWKYVYEYNEYSFPTRQETTRANTTTIFTYSDFAVYYRPGKK